MIRFTLFLTAAVVFHLSSTTVLPIPKTQLANRRRTAQSYHNQSACALPDDDDTAKSWYDGENIFMTSADRIRIHHPENRSVMRCYGGSKP